MPPLLALATLSNMTQIEPFYLCSTTQSVIIQVIWLPKINYLTLSILKSSTSMFFFSERKQSLTKPIYSSALRPKFHKLNCSTEIWFKYGNFTLEPILSNFAIKRKKIETPQKKYLQFRHYLKTKQHLKCLKIEQPMQPKTLGMDKG